MHEPDGRCGHRGHVGPVGCEPALPSERFTNDPPDEQAIGQMDGDVDDMEARGLQAVDGVVEGEREVGERTVREFAPFEHRPPGGHERANCWVVANLREIVPEERPPQARQVGKHREHHGREQEVDVIFHRSGR